MSDFRYDLNEVIAKELPYISTRRAACQGGTKVTESDLAKDLRGLALSGGGIRSASLSLGLVQAFDALGLMRTFDYLSTVSGGGYLGGYLSSSIVARGAADESSSDQSLYPKLQEIKLENKDVHAGQSDRVQRFVFGGKYLHKPWQLANRYLIGLFLNNLTVLSGFAFVCCLAAILYRCLDFESVRNLAEIFGLNYDTNVVFFPFSLFFIAWLLTWVGSYLYPNKVLAWIAQLLLYCMAATFLFGCTLILVNGETTLNCIMQAVFNQDAIVHDGTVKSILLTIIAAGLIPFLLNPRVLLQRGLHPEGLLDRWVFRISCSCLLVGVPLVVFGYFGMQNISRSAGSPESKFSAGDIYDWRAFCKLLVPDIESARDAIEAVPDDFEPVRRKLGAIVDQVAALNKLEMTVWKQQQQRDADWPAVGGPAFQWWLERDRQEQMQSALCHDVNAVVLNSPAVVTGLANDTGLVRAVAEYHRDREKDNPSPDSLDAVEALIKSNCADPVLGMDKMANRCSSALEGIRQAKTYEFHQHYEKTAHGRDDKEWRVFNQNVLVAAEPDCFRYLDEVHRAVVTGPDQWVRLKWLVALGVACLVALTIDLNATGLHGFYRDRLAFAYLERGKETGKELALSDLNTTAAGAPYHLINASLNRFDSRFGHLFEKSTGERSKTEPDRRSTRNFLLSRASCGSEVTDFVATESFEKMTECPVVPRGLSKNRRPINLADAVAISGAALNPLQFDFAPLAWMMTALNLRLGQWLPNPACQTDRDHLVGYAPRLWTMLLDMTRKVEKRRLCFISDGGFNENLGIVPLLKRRCKLIVAIDAGCDPKELFADLGRVIRLARSQEGIEIQALTNESEHPSRHAPLDIARLRKNSQGISAEHYAVGLIKYPPLDGGSPEEGLLVYIKPTFTGDEGADLAAYQAEDCAFPHDSTADQLYDEVRVEAYRQLGYHMGLQVGTRLFGGMKGLDIDLTKVRSAAEKERHPEPLSSSQSLTKIAQSLDSMSQQPLPRFERESMMPGAGLRAVQRVATICEHLIDKDGHFANSSNAVHEFGELSTQMSRLAKELEQSPEVDQQIAQAINRLSNIWQSIADGLATAPSPDFAKTQAHQDEPAEPASAAVTSASQS